MTVRADGQEEDRVAERRDEDEEVAAAPGGGPAWREGLAAALQGRDPTLGAAVPRLIGAFILLTAVAVALETMPGLPGWLRILLGVFEVVAVSVFLCEYILRLIAAERPLRYATSLWGIIDLLSFLPTLLLLGFDLLGLRALRLLRLLRLLKLIERDAPVRRLWQVLGHVRDELVAVLAAGTVTLYLAAAGIYFFEHEAQPQAFSSIPASMWWAVATLTTVGYGDVVPVTAGGRIFTGIVMLIGIGIVAVPTALLASALMASRRRHYTTHDIDERLSGPLAERVAELVEREFERRHPDDGSQLRSELGKSDEKSG
ncbi:MAG: potassium channel family protein [Pseudomonadota bacterium]